MCSMISGQCDELRKTADELDERAKAYAPTGRNVLSPMLRTAADTIWELSCKLAGVVDQSDEIERLKDENAELRRLVRTYRACHDHVDACRGCSELPDCEALEKMRSIGRELGIEVE